METDNKVLIECKQSALVSWGEHKEWLLNQLEHEHVSFWDQARMRTSVRHADEQIQLLHNEIEKLEAEAAEPKKAESFTDVGAEYAYGSWRRFSRQTRVF